jgi:hypothetical protein
MISFSSLLLIYCHAELLLNIICAFKGNFQAFAQDIFANFHEKLLHILMQEILDS